MAMDNVSLFLDLFKQLEDVLENKYSNARRRYSSVVFEYIKSPESDPVREKLEVCREIRNLLTHSANINGEAVVTPSPSVISAMEEIIKYVKRPPLAIDFATKGDNVMKAHMNQRVLRLMEVMKKNGFSHVPVLENGSFRGVFSIGTIFLYVLAGGKHITAETTLQDVRAFIPVKEHIENYAFVPKDTTYPHVRKLFERVKGRNNRLSVIFITEQGREDERMLGMITPWDVMKEIN